MALAIAPHDDDARPKGTGDVAGESTGESESAGMAMVRDAIGAALAATLSRFDLPSDGASVEIAWTPQGVRAVLRPGVDTPVSVMHQAATRAHAAIRAVNTQAVTVDICVVWPASGPRAGS